MKRTFLLIYEAAAGVVMAFVSQKPSAHYSIAAAAAAGTLHITSAPSTSTHSPCSFPAIRSHLCHLQVLGQSRSWVLRLLNYEDEVFALVSLLLERHSLSTMHATFAESLYGLKRQPAPPSSLQQTAAAAAGGGTPGAGSALGLLSRKQQYQALLCEVRKQLTSAANGFFLFGCWVSATACVLVARCWVVFDAQCALLAGSIADAGVGSCASALSAAAVKRSTSAITAEQPRQVPFALAVMGVPELVSFVAVYSWAPIFTPNLGCILGVCCWLLPVQVLLPYLQAKCAHLYSRHAQQQGGVLGMALARSAQQQQQQQQQQQVSHVAAVTAMSAAFSLSSSFCLAINITPR
jgi:hypothetical protein